jgi:hypothetical protein
VTGSHCQPAAPFHAHRPHPPTRLVGPVRYHRAYYLGRRGGTGSFPFDQPAGLRSRNLTPARARSVARAGTVADSFAKAAAVGPAIAGPRRGAATGERTTEEAGQRRAQQLPAGTTFGTPVVWSWQKDSKGRSCAYLAQDATGLRQQGKGGAAAAGRRAYGGMVGNPAPAGRGPDEKRPPLRARYGAGLYPLEEVGPLFRRPAAPVGMEQAECWRGRTDGGNGRADRLGENFPLVWAVIRDCYHPAERLFGRTRRLYPGNEARAPAQRRAWCQLLQAEGGVLRAAVLREGDGPGGRPGWSAAVAEVVG